MENLNDAFFAYPTLRKYPVDTKEHTISSYGAYKMQKEAFKPETREKIEAGFTKAASFYGIELEKDDQTPREREKLLFKGASEGVCMTEITNKAELEAAVDFLLEKRASVPRSELAEAAKYVLWSASSAGVDINNDKYHRISRIAGIGVGDRDAIENEFMKRATFIPLGGKNKEEFWKFANELREMSDAEFYTEDNLNRVCNTIDSMDFISNNQHKHAGEIGYPEDVVFKDTVDDLCKEASDLMLVKSADATLSKKALLERKDSVNAFFTRVHGGYEALDGDDLINKVASCEKSTFLALLDYLEGAEAK